MFTVWPQQKMKLNNTITSKIAHKYKFVRQIKNSKQEWWNTVQQTDKANLRIKLQYFTFRHSNQVSFYRPPTKLREGNVFTGVCHSVRGWVSLSTPPPSCPRHGTSGEACEYQPCHPIHGTSRSEYPTHLPRHRIQRDMFGNRAVRILLECFLVCLVLKFGFHNMTYAAVCFLVGKCMKNTGSFGDCCHD